jgi:hypothetical protein
LDTVFNVRFDALRNAVYHASRRRFFELLSRSLSFLVVVSGTAAVASVAGWDPRWPAAGAAVIGALQLVFDFNGRARLHERLQQKYFELISAVDKKLSPSEADVAQWRSDLGIIYADEPPPMKALDAIAYNKACDSLGCPDGVCLSIGGSGLCNKSFPFRIQTSEQKSPPRRHEQTPLID